MDPTKANENSARFSKAVAWYLKTSVPVTLPFAEEALSLMPAITSESVVHDNACGPAVISLQIASKAKATGQTPKIFATDVAEGMVQYAQSTFQAEGFDNASAQVMDGQDLSRFEDRKFSHSITNFAFFGYPDSAKGAKEIYRTLKPGGVAAVTIWKYAATMKLVDRVMKAARPDKSIPQPFSDDWQKEWKVASVMGQGGFDKENIKVVEKRSFYREEGGAADIVAAFMDPFWDAVKNGWTDEEKERWNPKTIEASLTEEERKTGQMQMDAWICIATK